MVLTRIIAVQLLFILSMSGCDTVLGRKNDAAAPAVQSVSRNSANEEYRLGTGDVISVRVYGGEEDIRLERIRLDNSGTISLPFGEFKAAGQTTKELETGVTDSVRGRLLRNPRVWVNIEEYRSFYVEGQVGRPGAYPYQPGLNVRKAVTIAGGFRERASLQKIFVVRERDTGNSRVKVDLNSAIAPGDTVTVEESLF